MGKKEEDNVKSEIQNPRPTRVENAIKRADKELVELFQKIRDDKKLDMSKTALIPLTRRGIGILPRLDEEESQENDLINILKEFGYYEEYALFPHKKKLEKCSTVIIFDDVCESGRSFYKYREYFLHFSKASDLCFERKHIKIAAYVVKVSASKKVKVDYHLEPLEGEKYENKIIDLYEVIASKGAILDPDHMLISAEFEKKKNFFNVQDHFEEIAKSNNCDLIEDGIEFFHPRKKKIGLYVRKNIRENLVSHGLSFPDFVTEVDIAKFRMVFDLEIGGERGKEEVFTTGFKAVPIINPIIRDFSVDACLNSWCPSFRFCEKDIISKEFCSRKYRPEPKYLIENYYHPRYDCILGNIVSQFKKYFWGLIACQFEDIKPPKVKWHHQYRVRKKWLNIQNLLEYKSSQS